MPHDKDFPEHGHWSRAVLAGIAVACLWLSMASYYTRAWASESGSPAGTAHDAPGAGDDASIEGLGRRIEELRQRISAGSSMLSQAPSAGTEGAARLAGQVDLMKYLVAVLTQRQATAESLAESQQEQEQRREELKRLRTVGLDTEPPYSLLMLEELRDQLTVVSLRRETLEAEIATTRDLLAMVRQSSQQGERDRRKAREALQHNNDPLKKDGLAAAYDAAVLLASIARETACLREMELKNLEIQQQTNTLFREYLEQQIQLIGDKTTFSEVELRRMHQDLAETEKTLSQQMDRLGTELKEIEQKWLAARTQSSDSSGTPVAEEAAKAWQLARDVHQKEMSALNRRLAQTAILRTLWQARYRVFNHLATPAQMEQWRQQLAGLADRLDRSRRLSDLDFEKCRTDLALLEYRLQQSRTQQPQIASWVQFQIDQLQGLMRAHAATFAEIESGSAFVERFGAELQKVLQIKDRTPWMTRASAWVASVWNYELLSVSDEPITVRKLVGTLIFLLVGWGVSRWLSRTLSRRILPRFGLDRGNAAALQSIAFYLAFILFAYFSLELIGVPLTVFAFLGGAAAIGIGFGSQNILNNFISGLILLIERPIRVGDLINIDGVYGNVESVGTRSTRVRTGSNLDIIIPNSRILENNVTNVTLSDERYRACVSVGVAYGSPTTRVAELLEQSVLMHRDVLKSPEPIVLFTDFADSSLNFEVHFWIRMRTLMQRQRIESDVRHQIDALLQQADITIAFPQRDIHLDASHPIEVRLQTGQVPGEQRQGVRRVA